MLVRDDSPVASQRSDDARRKQGRRRRQTTFCLGIAIIVGACSGAPTRPEVQSIASASDIAVGAGAELLATSDESPSALGSYLAARHAQKNNDADAAAEFFARALIEDPGNLELLRNAMVSALASGQIDKGLKYASRYYDIEKNAPIATLALASRDVAQSEFIGAMSWLEATEKNGYNRYFVPLLEAWVLTGQKRPELVAERLESLEEFSAAATQHAYHVGLISDLLDDPVQAETGYASAVGARQGGALRSVLAAGRFYERADRADEARALYDVFQDENPETLFLETALRRLATGATPDRLVSDARAGFAEALHGAATAFFQDNAFQLSQVYAALALHIRPDLDVAHMLLGDIYTTLGNNAMAAESFGAIGDDSPLSWAARLRWASSLDAAEQTEEAVGVLEAMALERPERADALISLGELYRMKERYAEAVDVYDQAFTRVPTIEPRHWTWLYARGMSLERTKQWPRAEKDLLHALELEPDQPLVLNYLGYSWVELGLNLDEARDMIERAVEQRPNDGYIVDSLGWVLYRMGEYADALPHLERAVEIRPSDPVIIDHFGDALWQVGRHEEARFQWRRALSFEPEPDLVELIELKLDGGLTEALMKSDMTESDDL